MHSQISTCDITNCLNHLWSIGAGSKFRKSEWYFGTTDSGWADPNYFNLLNEQNIEKYRLQRRLIGPIYSSDGMKDIEPNIDKVLEKNVKIMHNRVGEGVDADIFFNYFASGKYMFINRMEQIVMLILLLDCLSASTFSRENNLVGEGDDGSVHMVHQGWKYMHIVGYFPLVHKMLLAYGKLWEGDRFKRIASLFQRITSNQHSQSVEVKRQTVLEVRNSYNPILSSGTYQFELV